MAGLLTQSKEVTASHCPGHWRGQHLWISGTRVQSLSHRLLTLWPLDGSFLGVSVLICEIRLLRHVAKDLCEMCCNYVHEAFGAWHVGSVVNASP